MNTTENNEVEKEGYVLFLEYATGSRSEGIRPYLIQRDLSVIYVCFNTDNEYLNQTFRPLHRKCCKVRGRYFKESQEMRVSSVQEIHDPYES
jgi:hypothetical protein